MVEITNGSQKLHPGIRYISLNKLTKIPSYTVRRLAGLGRMKNSFNEAKFMRIRESMKP